MAIPAVSQSSLTAQGPVPGGIVDGYVFDEDGRPVPGAIVSLWQDGQLWQPGKFILGDGARNPATSNVPGQVTGGYLTGGSYRFGLLFPGEYTLTVEKDGYKGGPVSVHVGNETMRETLFSPGPTDIVVNVTLGGYRVPTVTPGQLAYTGAIVGEVRAVPGYRMGANMSLWQDGRMVDTLNNPQYTSDRNFSGKRVDYVFEHLAPGNYTIQAEYWQGYNFSDNISVTVDTRPMRADMVLSKAVKLPPYGWPTYSITPTIGVFSASDPEPTPTLPWLFVLLVFGFVAFFVRGKFADR